MADGGQGTVERCNECSSGKCSLRVAGTLLAEQVSTQAGRFDRGDFSDDHVMQSLYLIVEYLKIYVEGVYQVERLMADEARNLPEPMRYALAHPHERRPVVHVHSPYVELLERIARTECATVEEPEDWRAKLAEWHRLND
jgi:hypothetical protein